MIRKPNFLKMKAGDEIAVTSYKCFPDEVQEIATVRDAGPFFIQLHDGRKFSARDGIGFGTSAGTRIRHLDWACDGIGRSSREA